MSKPNPRLIIFFVPPEKAVNGGIMSIFSLCKESRRFYSDHKADVVLCTYPCFPSYKKNDLFENDEYVASFHELIKKYPNLDSLVLHVPELALKFLDEGLSEHKEYLQSIPKLHINIMNQNIRYMPDEATVASLYKYSAFITQTTAHDRYANQEICDKYAIPLHHFSVFIDSSQYTPVDYEAKSNLIVYSPDKQLQKSAIIDQLKAKLKNYDFLEIKNMTYSSYKEAVAKAKFTLTFGEGFDGYFIESVFSGGLPYAVYNEDFFPSPAFKNYPTIYADYNIMLKEICDDIKKLDNSKTYKKLNTDLHKQLETLYSFKNYLKNLEAFYKGHYSFMPKAGSKERFFAKAVEQKDELISEKDSILAEKEVVLREQNHRNEHMEIAVAEQAKLVNSLVGSFSWKLTRPLRQLSMIASKLKPRPRGSK